jgi:hypothetical protein
MKTNELLAKYPLATEVVRKFFFDKMIASVESAKDIPAEFKQSLMNEAITDERLIIFIDSQPRTLFDVFDENEVFIFIHYMDVKDNVEFFHSFRNIDTNPVKLFKTRKEAELFAIEAAFEILENKLSSNEVTEQE